MAHNSRQSGKTVIVFDEETTLASGIETSLVIYTNTTNETLLLDQLIATGQADGLFRVLFNSETIVKYRTSEQDRTLNLAFPTGLLLGKNDTIEIKVTNCWDEVADFSGTFIIHRSY